MRCFVFLALDGFALDLQLNQSAIQLVHDLGFGIQLDFDFGRGFVDQINRLVRQKPVGDVAVAQLSGGHNGRVGDLHTVVHFVFLLQAAQDGNGCLYRRFTDQNLLETALQSSVFFDVLAVLIQRGRAHAVQLAPCQSGLEHISRVHRALGFASADHGVQFVNEHYRLAFVFSQVFQHRFQALFKLTAKLCAR